tara:strand:+ start:418 stop:636 length:219 start_codon:yes stop_codon:yes gene_type:complete
VKKIKRTFSSLVRMPYQDAIAVVLHVSDFHIEMAVKEPNKREFHLKQATKLRQWLKDVKDYIVEKEESGQRD